MKGYIPKQPKQVKERVEEKLDVRLIRKLESYCHYLDSDRDYVISQALEIAFKKDKEFSDWLSRQPAAAPAEETGDSPKPAIRRGRKPNRSQAADNSLRDVATAGLPNTSALPAAKGA